jgi:cysteine desulfuration protein SufE
MTFYPEALQELVEEFQEVEDKRERLEMLFELADEIVELPATEWSEETRVRGCQSEAHVRVRVEDGLVHFFGAADAKLVQGLMGILSIAIEGLTPAQAVLIPVDFAQEMGLTNTLTPSRSNGFRNMYDKVMNEIRASVE